MKPLPLVLLSAAIGLAVVATDASAQKQQKIYKWLDEEGNVKFGDRIPPQYANRDRLIYNEQGIIIGFEEGEVTPEERAEKERLAALEAEEQERREERARHDQMLLDTYLTVDDIEDLRDRRLDLMDSQVRVTEFYLSNLHRKLSGLEKETQRFAPINEAKGAKPVPEYLALDISRVKASIELYETTLENTRREQQALRDSFERDIERFKTLKGG